MHSRRSFFLKVLGFLAICTAIYIPYCNLLTSNFIDDELNTRRNYTNFYKEEKDSMDVLFLGTSAAVTAFAPLALTEATGLTAWNLGSPQQSMAVSYWWLEEALRTQSPKYVVLDTYYTFRHINDSPLNSDEGNIRKAMDNMAWSSVKVEALRDMSRYSDDQQIQSYLFPSIRYHGRWTEAGELSFHWTTEPSPLRGYEPIRTWIGETDYAPYDPGVPEEPEDLDWLMERYLNRIRLLCSENGATLILTLVPNSLCSQALNASMGEWAEKYGLLFIDFNTTEIYEAMGYDFAADNGSQTHPNEAGAKKVTDYLASVLLTLENN